VIIRRVDVDEAAAITQLINSAFGPAEGFFIVGDRIDVDGVCEFFAKGAFLVCADYAGCVYVEPRGDRAYLGLLSVDPARQGGGIGKRLIAVAEEYARGLGARFMDIRVVNLRTELPPIYENLGYLQTGTEPWPEGVPSKLPCHFICMAKPLSNSI
jgi:GNAT superfamily N-acetyltransferase